MAIIRAAGGLVWRVGRDGRRRVAVIHRPHREDWSLPKGKLKDGEHWEQAALREVFEETGCRTRIVSFAGCVHYVPRRTPKIVLFWNMELVKEGPLQTLDEVDKVAWLTRTEALRRLDHDGERELLLEALELRHFEPPAESEQRRPARRPAAARPRREAAAEPSSPERATEEVGAGESGPETAVETESAEEMRAVQVGARSAPKTPGPASPPTHHEREEPARADESEPREPSRNGAEPTATSTGAQEGDVGDGAPEGPPPLPIEVVLPPGRRRLPHYAAGACAVAGAGLAARGLGPPGSVAVAIAACTLGWLVAAATARWSRTGRG